MANFLKTEQSWRKNMRWTSKYIQDSLFYEPWKTKFIEVFTAEYPVLKKEYNSANKNNRNTYILFVKYYSEVFKNVLKVLKNRLKFSGVTGIKFYSDIIYHAGVHNLISDTAIWFEAMYFLRNFYNDENCYTDFKEEYISIFEDFKNLMKPLVKKEGFREKNYCIYDNSCCLCGIKPKYYKRIISALFDHETVKIVRICGSRVTENYREFSDIDLISEGTYTGEEYMQIVDDLHSLEIPYIIDINDIFKESKPFIYRNVVRSNIFYKREFYCRDSYQSVI